MKIKEQDSQRMVIGPTLGERFGSAFWLAVVIAWGLFPQFVGAPTAVRVGFGAVAVLVGLLMLRGVIGSKIVIDKLTDSITVERGRFLLIQRRRVLPFSEVRSVVIDYEQRAEGGGTYGGGGLRDAWKVSLNIVGNKFKIDHTTKKADMWLLASGISSFMGKELVDNSAKPESSSGGFFRKVKGVFSKA